jgi:AcrR family transcriptional regulator
MLLAVGELGYDAASVETVLDRRKLKRSDFDRHFTGKQDCFARGCAEAWEGACDKLIVALQADAPRPVRLESMLLELLRLAAGSPTATRALLTGTHVAGSVALEARSATIARLIAALDGECGDLDISRTHPSKFGELIVGAIEGVIVRPLCVGEELDPDRLLPELLQFLNIFEQGDPVSGCCGR